MFSLYTYTCSHLVCLFRFYFQNIFLSFFEDLFLILAFIQFFDSFFLTYSLLLQKLIAEERCRGYKTQLTGNCFTAAKKPLRKSKESLNKLYLKQDKDLIVQIAALYYHTTCLWIAHTKKSPSTYWIIPPFNLCLSVHKNN